MNAHGVATRREIQGGAVCVAGTGTPTAVVRGMFLAGHSMERTAAFFGLTVEQVEAALRYEACRRTRRTQHAWARELRRKSLTVRT